MGKFNLVSGFKPQGDQPKAIEFLSDSIKKGSKHHTLLGVTGSGKTFTMACVINNVQKPTLVISHNKTLAAQLYNEFKTFFPENKVEYFVSYYDYYQPEAYIPQTDTYIEKDASINDEIDKLRHSATSAILSRRDVIVVSSVSCIYGIGSPASYEKMHLSVHKGMKADRDEILKKLVEIQYIRNDTDFYRGRFRVRGDILEVFPSSSDIAVRIEFLDDYIEKISEIDYVTGSVIKVLNDINIYPAQHWVTPVDELERAVKSIKEELESSIKALISRNKLVEAQRLQQRTNFDMEMLREIGSCKGIENYSRHLDGRREGEPPYTLLDYFPKDSLVIIDESHVSVPQIRSMYAGDMARKKVLIDYGFRLPSAKDNRPLYFEEFNKRIPQVIYVSATPAEYELDISEDKIAEQIIRPTGLVDPEVIIKPAKNQIDDLIGEIRKRVEKTERVLVTTLTKKMSEDLTDYLKDVGIKVRYLHSDIETLERIKIIKDLRLGVFDVLVGINLLREGLDIPEVSLVAILDADKEGFLRSGTTLIQTMGRAARNINGTVILYADKMTKSINKAVKETERRRKIQLAFNERHNITPETIKKSINDILSSIYEQDYYTIPVVSEDKIPYASLDELTRIISEMEQEMVKYASKLEFEKAAAVRDKIKELKKIAGKGDREIMFYNKDLSRDQGSSEIERKHKARRIGKTRSDRFKRGTK